MPDSTFEQSTQDQSASSNDDHESKRPDLDIEEIRLKGSQLSDRVKELMQEGRTRRIIIKKKDRVLLDIPMAGGVGGTAAAIFLLPTVAAIGMAAALATGIRIVVVRSAESEETP